MNEAKWMIISIIVAVIIIKLLNYRSNIKYLNKRWGKLPNTDFWQVDRKEYLNEVFEYMINEFGNSSIIDNYTSNDLDIFEILKRLDATKSNVGSNVLFYRLRTLDKSVEDRKLFEEKQNYFLKNPNTKTKIQYQFQKLGRNKQLNIIKFIKELKPYKFSTLFFHILLGLIPIASIIFHFLNISEYAILIFLPSAIFNTLYTYNQKNKLEDEYYSANQLTNIIKIANKIVKYDIPNKKKIKKEISGVKSIKYMSYLSISDSISLGDIGITFLNIIFMISFINFGLLNRKIYFNKNKIINLYMELGEIDVAIAVLNYKEIINDYCEAEFIEEYKLEGKNIYHPLIKKPVKNDVYWTNNILITGSNASGKSTYVKSVALNTIFAQTLYFAHAEKFRLKKGRVFSSMAIKDDVIEGESYFIAEIKSLKRIVNDIENKSTSYYFIDEILKGTNTKERIAASYSMIKYFVDKKILSFVATHDIELTELLNDEVRNVHFREHFTEDKSIQFDYKLYEGASRTTNAIKLLEIYDFPKDVLNSANSFIENQKK